jgi:hypothetical protein
LYSSTVLKAYFFTDKKALYLAIAEFLLRVFLNVKRPTYLCLIGSFFSAFACNIYTLHGKEKVVQKDDNGWVLA